MTYSTLAHLQRLWRHFAPNFGKSAKNPEMEGLWGTVFPERGWNAKIDFPARWEIVFCIFGCNSAKKNQKILLKVVHKWGTPKTLTPPPIATPLTECCNFLHFYSGDHSQDCHQIWLRSDHPKGLKTPPEIFPLKWPWPRTVTLTSKVKVSFDRVRRVP